MGRLVKGKLTAVAMRTIYKGFNCDWAWRRIQEMFPDEIAPMSVRTQESIRNEWTTFTRVNDWYTCNKKTVIDRLATDEKERLSDGSEAKITIGGIEKRRIINFDEMDHPFSTVPEKGGSRSVRWGDPAQAKDDFSFSCMFNIIMTTFHLFKVF